MQISAYVGAVDHEGRLGVDLRNLVASRFKLISNSVVKFNGLCHLRIQLHLALTVVEEALLSQTNQV